ncbi:PAS domain-containing sensor histidine kinase [Flavobacterium paronense]|uniref:histidine kinase n=1 Tax=Flavobacterium paronense TaxID=1392775 RepID=A0ABV5GC46_9FLAO|nr:PAS domain-containing sensor histidine kinase [Flavobacterium paronense]MDN3677796.1 PAS domain-containing sensor histidine kinase [Flavobacterium paronense]
MDNPSTISLEKEAGFKAIFNYATIGILVINSDGEIQLANPCIEKLFDYLNVELIGKTVEILLPEAYKKEHVKNRDDYFKNPRARVMGHGLNLLGIKKDGSKFPVIISLAHYQLDNENLAVAFISDNSEISRAHEELEAKVEERTVSLTHALEREKELNELKSRFVMMASHEFRTPLSAILSSISLIETYHKEEQKQNIPKHISRIKACVKDLNTILNDFLSIEKIEQGKIEIKREKFNLYDFSMDVIEEVNGILKPGQYINYVHHGEKEILQDKIILRNIILNLLSNAIKYSDENKVIHFITEVNADFISITIQDEGIGIPDNDQKKLFKKFYRANNVTNIKGTGLGLHIVKKYVEILKGTIRFSSSANNGTSFILELPLKK